MERILLFCGIILISFLISSLFILLDKDEDNYSSGLGLLAQIEEREKCWNNLLTGNRTSREYQMFMGPELYKRFQNELNQKAMSMTSDYYDSLRDYETYRYHYRPLHTYGYDIPEMTQAVYNTQKINTNMNTTVSNQEQQMESAVKYLSDKREKASEVVELNIKDYNKLVQENADLKAKSKASEDVIRIEQVDDYGDGTIVTYSGKDKTLADAVSANNKAQSEIRDLKQQLEIANEHIAEVQADRDKVINKEEKRLQDFYEQKFEKDNAKLIKNHKNEIKDLNNVIDDLNDKIQEANDRNKILADMNNRYKETLGKIMRYLSDRAYNFFNRKFKLKALLQADNTYRVSIPYQGDRNLYINKTTGTSYWA